MLSVLVLFKYLNIKKKKLYKTIGMLKMKYFFKVSVIDVFLFNK